MYLWGVFLPIYIYQPTPWAKHTKTTVGEIPRVVNLIFLLSPTPTAAVLDSLFQRSDAPSPNYSYLALPLVLGSRRSSRPRPPPLHRSLLSSASPTLATHRSRAPTSRWRSCWCSYLLSWPLPLYFAHAAVHVSQEAAAAPPSDLCGCDVTLPVYHHREPLYVSSFAPSISRYWSHSKTRHVGSFLRTRSKLAPSPAIVALHRASMLSPVPSFDDIFSFHDIISSLDDITCCFLAVFL